MSPGPTLDEAAISSPLGDCNPPLASLPAALFDSQLILPTTTRATLSKQKCNKHLSGLLLFMRILDIIYKMQHGLALSSSLVMSYIVLSPAIYSSHWGLFQ